MARSAVELGAALFALRRILRERAAAGGSGSPDRPTSRLLTKYLTIAKYTMSDMPPRSVANTVSALVGLKHADKLLLLRMAGIVQKLCGGAGAGCLCVRLWHDCAQVNRGRGCPCVREGRVVCTRRVARVH